LLFDSITKTLSGKSQAHSQTLRFWGKTQFKVILFITCLKQNFLGTKKIREDTSPECAAVATGLGRAKACKWVVKE